MAKSALRILVIANLPPYVMGGAENQVLRLIEFWLGAGASVEVAGHRIPDGTLAVGTTSIRLHNIGVWNKAGRFGRAAGYIISLARLAFAHARDFDVVYVRGMGDGAVCLAILSALGLCHWPFMAVPINAGGRGDIFFLRSIPGWRLICRLLNRHIRAINLINPLIARELDEVGIKSPPRSSIPNGVPIHPPICRDAVRPVRRLLWTGRLERQKGLDLLLPCLAQLHQNGVRFELSLIGDGPLRESLQTLATSLGIGQCIHFRGAFSSSEIRPLLKDADVFVLPSRYEGMSNSALEAMEAGLPVLCTRCGGVDQAVEQFNAGWVATPDDADSLRCALAEMFTTSDAGLLAMGKQARLVIESQFSMDSRAADNLALLDKTAQSNRSAR